MNESTHFAKMFRTLVETHLLRPLSAWSLMGVQIRDTPEVCSVEKPLSAEVLSSSEDKQVAIDNTADALARFLINEKIIEPSAIERAMRAARSTGERLDRVLTKLGLISDIDLVKALSRYLTLSIVDLADLPSEPLLTEVLPPDFVRRNQIMPLSITASSLIIGVTDPFNTELVAALAYITGRSIVVRIFVGAEFDRVFQTLYLGSDSSTENISIHGSTEANDTDIQRLRDIASEAPTIRVVNQIISKAVELQASDIHVQPTIESLLIRYRIDGILRTTQSLAPGVRAAIVSRIKIMAKLDIAERRMPQDGRIKLAIRGVDIDFRVSTIPTAFGESVVMRILDRGRVDLNFEKLGFSSDHISEIRELLRQTNGIILVTGPTGSGKTTTLYTALQELNSPDRKIFTVEDPIEYQLDGIDQVQVQPAIGLSFPIALRSILRQDPDVIMIGEIRDLETARIAIQASLTGHLVLSTLHTNSAVATITRLIDMGLESYLLASTLKGIVAQRLVRRLCARCSQPHRDAVYWETRIRLECPRVEGAPNIRDASGCELCGGLGYVGRSTVAEIAIISEEMRRLVLAAAPEAEIEGSAQRLGMISMYENGVTKVLRGETSIDEVLRTVGGKSRIEPSSGEERKS